MKGKCLLDYESTRSKRWRLKRLDEVDAENYGLLEGTCHITNNIV